LKLAPFKSALKGPVQFLLLGVLIYVLFRSNKLYVNKWLLNHTLGFELQRIRTFTLSIRDYLPEWLIYSLPDALWMLSLSTLIYNIWKDESKKNQILWSLFPPIIAISWEVAQRLKLINGTFDWVDLLFYGLVTITLIFKLKTTRYEKTI
jgi:hypothetical protein